MRVCLRDAYVCGVCVEKGGEGAGRIGKGWG